MDARFFTKIGVEMEDGRPIIAAGAIEVGQSYFVGPDKGIYQFKGRNRKERKASEAAYLKAGGRLTEAS